MQSRAKFEEYFHPNIDGELMTVEDFRDGKLNKRDKLFLNWQKINAKNADSRKLRRPKDEEMRKETGFYFEDVMENTHAEGRKIILIIDESHISETTKLSKDTIDKINPKIIISVTATPKDEAKPGYQDVLRGEKGHVSVERDAVITAGLIKERIVTQTEDDLLKYTERDMDEILLDLAIERRKELVAAYKVLGKDINPLVLIQIPNDDKKIKDTGIVSKDIIVRNYLNKKGIASNKVAYRFNDNYENYDEAEIAEHDNEIDFLVFKQAMATGWDCPRAHILVMFREINSSTFYTQTIGRILRMPEPHKSKEYKNSALLRTAYLYTNYSRNQLKMPDEAKGNKPFIHTAKRKENITNIELLSEFVSRVDYGDLADADKFQESFLKMKFIHYLESKKEKIDWWYKNGDSGKEAYALKYFNTTDQADALFYPDWIIRFKDGRIGIFDTKDGITASNTEGRAEGLYQKIKILNEGNNIYIGGILIFENAQWYCNNAANYTYIKGNLDGWALLETII